MDNGGPALASVGTDRRPSNSSSTGSGNSASKKRHHRNFKGLVDYTSEVSSEDFSGPEDGEVDSDAGGRVPVSPPSPPPPQTFKPGLVANASPIDDEDIDLGEKLRSVIVKQTDFSKNLFFKREDLSLQNLSTKRKIVSTTKKHLASPV